MNYKVLIAEVLYSDLYSGGCTLDRENEIAAFQLMITSLRETGSIRNLPNLPQLAIKTYVRQAVKRIKGMDYHKELILRTII